VDERNQLVCFENSCRFWCFCYFGFRFSFPSFPLREESHSQVFLEPPK